MGKPVWGTCAGLIFLADKAIGELFLSKVLNCGPLLQLQSQCQGFMSLHVCIVTAFVVTSSVFLYNFLQYQGL